MKTSIKFLVLCLAAFAFTANIASYPTGVIFQVPPKTIIFKDPNAESATYFSQTKMFRMWMFKAGTNDELNKTIKLISKDPAVESCIAGTVTGDYTEINLALRSAQNKTWFKSLMQKAGITSIKINNQPAVSIAEY